MYDEDEWITATDYMKDMIEADIEMMKPSETEMED